MKRILHISDLHLCHIPKNPLQWISKAGTTYLGMLLNSKRRFDLSRPKQLLSLIESLDINHVVISGDLTCSGSDDEFFLFDEFFQSLKNSVKNICLVPGNHDLYTERDVSKGFYKHASKWMSEEIVKSLFEKRQASMIADDVEYLLLDLCAPRPLFHAEGTFDQTQAHELQEALKKKPAAKHRIVVGHYPMHPTESPANQLIGYQKLEAVFREDKTTLAYLHGHTHQQHIIDERFFGLPVSIESGSLSDPDLPGFSIIELYEASTKASLYRPNDKGVWQPHQEIVWQSQPKKEISSVESLIY